MTNRETEKIELKMVRCKSYLPNFQVVKKIGENQKSRKS